MYWNTVKGLLKESLVLLMNAPEFTNFRLVGGTALSLQTGHRMSVDIDLFTDVEYGTIDFGEIDRVLKTNFKYVDSSFGILPGMGRSYIVGSDKYNSIKLDIYYTDRFIQAAITEDGIRMATVEEIIAMKVDVIARGGRKKDFWDIHELLGKYTIAQMLALHQLRYTYDHNEKAIINSFSNFEIADDDFEPLCLRGKYWELIKLDILDELESL